jgi:amino acid transporter
LLYGLILALHGILNQFGVRLVALLNDISVWWHIVGVLVIVGVLAFAPSHHQSAGFVFGHLVNNTGLGLGWWYIIPVGLLLAQYTFTGYDASAHMTAARRAQALSFRAGIARALTRAEVIRKHASISAWRRR